MRHEDEDFESLRRLLAWKSHEVPPPGFFTRLPDRILTRLREEEAARAVPWWERLVNSLRLRPAWAGAFALAAGGLYLLSLSTSTPADGRLPASLATHRAAPREPAWSRLPAELASLAGDASGSNAASLSTRPVLPAAPPSGLFAPGAGLRGGLVPAVGSGSGSGVVTTGLHLIEPTAPTIGPGPD